MFCVVKVELLPLPFVAYVLLCVYTYGARVEVYTISVWVSQSSAVTKDLGVSNFMVLVVLPLLRIEGSVLVSRCV